MNKKKRFTLIELLVVIAIIGILASLLLPSLVRARKSAIQTSCLGNMKQLVLILSYYYDDNDHYPKSTDSAVEWIGKKASDTAEWDVLPSERVLNAYIFPGRTLDDDVEVPLVHCGADDFYYDQRGSSYSPNANTGLGKNLRWTNNNTPITYNDIKNPLLFTTFVEVSPMMSIRNGVEPANVTEHQKAYYSNMTFADGHAAYTRFFEGEKNTSLYLINRHK